MKCGIKSVEHSKEKYRIFCIRKWYVENVEGYMRRTSVNCGRRSYKAYKKFCPMCRNFRTDTLRNSQMNVFMLASGKHRRILR
jgi:hypothetical protein